MMKEFFEKIHPIFSKYQNEKYAEFEMRLGKINRGQFDTNVGQETFEKVLKGLRKYTCWEKVSKTCDTVYYSESVRRVIDDETEKSVQVHKQKLTNLDYSIQNKPFDVRFSVAKEIPDNREIEEFDSARTRTRESFVRKNLVIDMTIVSVSKNPDDMDSEEEYAYQIEFEIIDPTKVSDKNTLYNIVYKIINVLDLS